MNMTCHDVHVRACVHARIRCPHSLMPAGPPFSPAQFEYMLDGTACQPWNIGEWSLDKRHFNDVHPAYPLPAPPAGANEAVSHVE